MALSAALRALIVSLRAEGTASLGNPSPAPWGDRVYLQTGSQVVELSGGRKGNPVLLAWPCLILTGPRITEDTKRRALRAKERISEDRTAGTMSVRRWPRWHVMEFDCAYQTRAGSTGSVTLTESELAGVQRWLQWVERTPVLTTVGTGSGANETAQTVSVVPTVAMGDGGRRPTPADIREARGTVQVRDVRVWAGEAETVPTVQEIVVGMDVE